VGLFEWYVLSVKLFLVVAGLWMYVKGQQAMNKKDYPAAIWSMAQVIVVIVLLK
jgi:uncharacterized membrane protein YidH (DUF202 family)